MRNARHTRVGLLPLLVATAAIGVACDPSLRPGLETPEALLAERQAQIEIDSIPALVVVSQTVTGPYSQHPKVFSEMGRYITANYSWLAYCIGIYPDDPDVVASDALTWQVVFPVSSPGLEFSDPYDVLEILPKPAAGYELRVLPATAAAVLVTNVKEAATDGLALIDWIVRNGYVQIAPTRMEFLADAEVPEMVPTRIVIPVVERTSGLRLDGASGVR